MPIHDICTLKNLYSMICESAKLDVGVEKDKSYLSHPSFSTGILKSSQMDNLPFALFIFQNDNIVIVCLVSSLLA